MTHRKDTNRRSRGKLPEGFGVSQPGSALFGFRAENSHGVCSWRASPIWGRKLGCQPGPGRQEPPCVLEPLATVPLASKATALSLCTQDHPSLPAGWGALLQH